MPDSSWCCGTNTLLVLQSLDLISIFNFKLSSLQNNNELNCVLVFVCILRAKLAIDDLELARHALLQKEDKNDKQKSYF